MVNFQPGQLVRSLAGRDRERWLIVLKVLDERFVEVADGSLRPVDKPKKKNMKHLAASKLVDPELVKKLENSIVPSNEEVQAAINRLIAREGL